MRNIIYNITRYCGASLQNVYIIFGVLIQNDYGWMWIKGWISNNFSYHRLPNKLDVNLPLCQNISVSC